MDPFYGSYPAGPEETLKYSVNRIISLSTPLEIDFLSSEFLSEISKNEISKSEISSRIDSLFDSDSELSDIIEDPSGKNNKLKNPFLVSKHDFSDLEKDFREIKKLLRDASETLDKKSRKLFKCASTESVRKSVIRASDDNCTVCLGKGEVVCCDSCPRVFHSKCLNENLKENSSEIWECVECRFKKELKNEKYTGIFQELLESIQGKNPRIFQLPSNIVNSFENIIKHPKTGDFLLKSDVEFIHLNSEKQIRDRNPTIKGKKEEIELLNAYCFKCSRSNLKLLQTNLLSSYSISQPKGLKLQSCTSDLIKCDFCPLYWHLDCLDPPLASVPPALRENEIEIVDLRSIKAIKEKIWGKDSVNSGAGTLNSRYFLDDLVSIRKKWMCPCHSQNVGNIQSSGWKWCTVYENPDREVISGDDILLFSNSSQNNGQIEIKNEEETDKLFDEMENLHSKRSIGPVDRFEINGIRYRVPEKRIKLDFFAKSAGVKYHTNSEKYRVLRNGEIEFREDALQNMFPGFDSKVQLVNSDDSFDMLLEAAKHTDEPSTSQAATDEEYLAAMSEITNPNRMKRIKTEPPCIVIHPDDPSYANFLEWQKLKKRNPFA